MNMNNNMNRNNKGGKQRQGYNNNNNYNNGSSWSSNQHQRRDWRPPEDTQLNKCVILFPPIIFSELIDP